MCVIQPQYNLPGQCCVPPSRQEAKAWSIATAVEESQKHLRLASGTPTPSCRWSPFLVAICAGVPWCHRAPLWVITTVGRQEARREAGRVLSALGGVDFDLSAMETTEAF